MKLHKMRFNHAPCFCFCIYIGLAGACSSTDTVDGADGVGGSAGAEANGGSQGAAVEANGGAEAGGRAAGGSSTSGGSGSGGGTSDGEGKGGTGGGVGALSGAGGAPTVAPGRLFLFASSGSRIETLSVNTDTGLLTKGDGMQACGEVVHLALDRVGKRLYGACPGDKGLVVLSINQLSGELKRIGFAKGGTAVGVGVHPDGDFALTADYDGGGSLFKIDGDNPPSKVQSVSAGGQPHGAAFDGSGRYAYIANAGSNSIHQFSFAIGRLTPLQPASVQVVGPEPTFDGRKEPRYLVGPPDGKSLYVIGQRPPSVFAFAISASGGLTKLGAGASSLATALSSDINGKDVVVHPSLPVLYSSVYANNTIALFSISAIDHTLAFKGAVDTRQKGPSQLAMDPAGQFLFATHQTSHTIAGFHINANDGVLTPTGSTAALDAGTQALVAVRLK